MDRSKKGLAVCKISHCLGLALDILSHVKNFSVFPDPNVFFYQLQAARTLKPCFFD